jgi:hypothetical protein
MRVVYHIIKLCQGQRNGDSRPVEICRGGPIFGSESHALGKVGRSRIVLDLGDPAGREERLAPGYR